MQFAKLKDTYYRVCEVKDDIINCDPMPFNEEQVFEMLNKEKIQEDPLALHYFQRYKDLEREMKKSAK